jgi:hypothetical protein
MRFIGSSLRDAARLLVAAPVDLMLGVAALFILGALLTVTGASPILGLVLNFLGSTLLGAGLVGRPTPDGLAAAGTRLGRRLTPALGQVVLAILGIGALIVLVALVQGVLLAFLAPEIAQRLTQVTASREAFAREPAFALLAIPFLLVLVVIAGRLLPSAGLVLDRPVGALESLRLAWASTRGRTVSCAVLLLLSLAPNWLLVAFLPPTMSAFLAIISVVFAVAVGVATYRRLLPDSPSSRPLAG